METVVMRVWLPDRPGALGAVASRIGAIRGDLIGIDILERGASRAIDELVIALPDLSVIDLLVNEVSQVDSVDVEEVRPCVSMLRDPRLDALETAATLVSQRTPADLLDVLVDHAMRDFEAGWAVVLDVAGPHMVAAAGSPPPAPWLNAFVEGSRVSMLVARGETGPDELAWASLADADLELVLGRTGRPFRARERHQLSALARIADQRWFELSWRTARLIHPSVVDTR
jgi:hypothetical protein